MATPEQLSAIRKKYRQSEKGKACTARRAASERGRSKNKDVHLKSKYGITLEQFNEMLAQQECKCAICSTPLTVGDPNSRDVACVDHSHKTGDTRSILCKMCNLILGHADDSIVLLTKCVEYLERHSTHHIR